MTARKASKQEEKEEVKDVSSQSVENKRNELINGLRDVILTQRDLWKGGSEVRSRHSQEALNYQPIVDEINELGKQLDEPFVTLGSLRREG